MDVRDAVRARQELRDVSRLDRCGHANVCAHVHVRARAQRQDRAVLVAADLDLAIDLA